MKGTLPKKEEDKRIFEDNYLIRFLKNSRYPILYEDVRFSSDGIKRENIEAANIASCMQVLSAAVAVPIMGEKQVKWALFFWENVLKNWYTRLI